MKATVIEILSGSQYSDGKRRVTLQFEAGVDMYKRLRIKEEDLDQEVNLDDEVELAILHIGQVVKVRELEESLPVIDDEVAHGS